MVGCCVNVVITTINWFYLISLYEPPGNAFLKICFILELEQDVGDDVGVCVLRLQVV